MCNFTSKQILKPNFKFNLKEKPVFQDFQTERRETRNARGFQKGAVQVGT